MPSPPLPPHPHNAFGLASCASRSHRHWTRAVIGSSTLVLGRERWHCSGLRLSESRVHDRTLCARVIASLGMILPSYRAPLVRDRHACVSAHASSPSPVSSWLCPDPRFLALSPRHRTCVFAPSRMLCLWSGVTLRSSSPCVFTISSSDSPPASVSSHTSSNQHSTAIRDSAPPVSFSPSRCSTHYAFGQWTRYLAAYLYARGPADRGRSEFQLWGG